VTIPKAVREGLGLRPGDDVEFVAGADGYRLRKLVRANPFTRYRGVLRELTGQSPDTLVRQLRGLPPPASPGTSPTSAGESR
jgi:AbrB family looped-hinge helix DNA binding protein